MTSNALLERVAAIEAHASEAEARQRVELGNALLRRVAAIEAEHAAEAAAEGRGEAYIRTSRNLTQGSRGITIRVARHVSWDHLNYSRHR